MMITLSILPALGNVGHKRITITHTHVRRLLITLHTHLKYIISVDINLHNFDLSRSFDAIGVCLYIEKKRNNLNFLLLLIVKRIHIKIHGIFYTLH